MEGRRDIDPVGIPWVLPFIRPCDHLPEERDFRYRLADEAIREAHGQNIGRPATGERIAHPLSIDGGRADMTLGLSIYQRGTIHPDHGTRTRP